MSDEPNTRRARLLRVTVQAHLAVDDGDTLEPFSGPVVDVPGSRWAEFAAGAFGEDDMAMVLAQYDKGEQS